MVNKIKELGYMMDCSRGAVAKVDTIKRLVDILAKFGYDYLMLYTEDTYEIKEEPYFGYMRGRYSQKELKEIDSYCSSKGIELRPCIQTLAHLGRLLAHDNFTPLFDIDDVLLVNEDKVYQLIDKMFSNMSKSIKSKIIHIGMDEAFHLGRGRYIDKYGYKPKNEIINEHLYKVANIAKKYGYTCYIWADMLENAYLENNKKCNIPDNVIPMIWGYDQLGEDKIDKRVNLYKELSPTHLAMCGGIIKWVGFSPLNTYSFALIDEQIKAAKKYDLDNYLVAGWGDGAADASQFSILPGLFYAALRAKDKEFTDINKKIFKEAVGLSFDKFMKVDILSTLDPNIDYSHIRNSLSFIHLYADVLQNPMLEVALDKYELLYENASKNLFSISHNKNWGYIFKSLSQLAVLDKYLSTLGKNIFDTYTKKDDLTPCIKQARRALFYLNKFIKTYEIQWLKENKAFGYEKQLLRLGGLKERIRYVIDMLIKYKKGIINQIDELEVNHLPKIVNGKALTNPDEVYANWYRYFVSAGILNDM